MEQNQQIEDVEDDRFNIANYIGIYTKNQDIVNQYLGDAGGTVDGVLNFRLYIDLSGDTVIYTLPVLKGFRYDSGLTDAEDVNTTRVFSEIIAHCKEKRIKLKAGEWLFEIPDVAIVETDDYFKDEWEVPAEFLIRASSGEYLSACETYSALTLIWDSDCYEFGPVYWKKDKEVPYIEIDDDTTIRFECDQGYWTTYHYHLWDKAAVFAGIREAQEKTKLLHSDIPGPIKVEVLELDKVRDGYLFTTEEVQRAVEAFDARICSPGDTSYFGRYLTEPFESVAIATNINPDNVTHSVTAMTIEDGKLWARIEFWPCLKSRWVHALYEKKLGEFRVCYSGEMYKVENGISVSNMKIIGVDFVDADLLEYAALL